MTAGARTPGAGRTMAIDVLLRDVQGCGRCGATDANVDAALVAADGVLRATGTRVELRRVHVRSDEQARELGLTVAPTIRVNGRDISPEPLASACGDGCGCGCGPDAACRVWRHAGRDHAAPPVALIVEAIVAGLAAGAAGTAAPRGCCS